MGRLGFMHNQVVWIQVGVYTGFGYVPGKITGKLHAYW